MASNFRLGIGRILTYIYINFNDSLVSVRALHTKDYPLNLMQNRKEQRLLKEKEDLSREVENLRAQRAQQNVMIQEAVSLSVCMFNFLISISI